MFPLAVSLCFGFATSAGVPDWVPLLELTLANYALSRANTAPDHFQCTTEGKDHDSCKCWDKHGNALDGDDCHEPKDCLMYENPDTKGFFNFTKIANTTAALHQALSKWSVPSDMHSAFDAAALVESATFTTFHLDVKDSKAHFDAHVGTVRNYQGSFYVGYTWGSSDGDMVQPYSRHNIFDGAAPVSDPSVVVCKFFKMEKRDYTDDEIEEINNGLQSFAYKKAAKMVPQP